MQLSSLIECKKPHCVGVCRVEHGSTLPWASTQGVHPLNGIRPPFGGLMTARHGARSEEDRVQDQQRNRHAQQPEQNHLHGRSPCMERWITGRGGGRPGGAEAGEERADQQGDEQPQRGVGGRLPRIVGSLLGGVLAFSSAARMRVCTSVTGPALQPGSSRSRARSAVTGTGYRPDPGPPVQAVDDDAVHFGAHFAAVADRTVARQRSRRGDARVAWTGAGAGGGGAAFGSIGAPGGGAAGSAGPAWVVLRNSESAIVEVTFRCGRRSAAGTGCNHADRGRSGTGGGAGHLAPAPSTPPMADVSRPAVSSVATAHDTKPCAVSRK